jgi:hypothetical protein
MRSVAVKVRRVRRIQITRVVVTLSAMSRRTWWPLTKRPPSMVRHRTQGDDPTSNLYSTPPAHFRTYGPHSFLSMYCHTK